MPISKIYPYRQGSVSARALADALGVRVLNRNTTWRPGGSSRVVNIINWGSSTIPTPLSDSLNVRFINSPHFVRIATDKITFLRMMRSSVPRTFIPPWTTDVAVARRWASDGAKIVVRHLSRASGGRGIELYDPRTELITFPVAPLYTRYIPKRDEYRIHLGRHFPGNIVRSILNQRKARALDVPDDEVNWQIRNYENGFIYQQDIPTNDIPPMVMEAAMSVFDASGLTFGAVDVIYNERHNLGCCLEINTAPGLEGTTLERYANFFQENF